MMASFDAGSKNKFRSSSVQASATQREKYMGRLKNRRRDPLPVAPRDDPEGISMGSSTPRPSTRQPLQGNNYRAMEAKISKIVDEFLLPWRLDPEKYDKIAHQLSHILNEKIDDIRKRFSVDHDHDQLQESLILYSQVPVPSNADMTKKTATNPVQVTRESSSSPSSSDENLNESNTCSVNETNGALQYPDPRSSNPEFKALCDQRSTIQPATGVTGVHAQKESLSMKDQIKLNRVIEITDDRNICLIPFPRNNEMHLMAQSTTSPTKCTFITYKMIDPYTIHQSSQDMDSATAITLCPTTCKVFCSDDNILLLNGKLNKGMWRLNLHNLDTKNLHACWKPVSNLAIIESLFNLENSVAVSYKDKIIVASILSSPDRIIFHLVTAGKQRISANSLLPQHSATKYQIKACIIVSESIYCSLVHEEEACVYKFSITALQQHQKSIRSQFVWYIKESDHPLTSCFVSVYEGEVIVIFSYVADNKTIVGVKCPKPGYPVPISTERRSEFPYKVNIISVTVFPGFEIGVVYQENGSNSSYIKTMEMSSNNCIGSTSVTQHKD